MNTFSKSAKSVGWLDVLEANVTWILWMWKKYLEIKLFEHDLATPFSFPWIS